MEINQRIERIGAGEYLTIVTVIDGEEEKVYEKTFTMTSPIYSAYKSLISVLRGIRHREVTLVSNNWRLLSEIKNREIENGMALLNMLEDILERNHIEINVKMNEV